MNNSSPNTPSVYTSRLTVSNYAFPLVDGSANQCLVTNGAGTLSFVSIGDVSGVITGTGTNDRLVRWDVSDNVQSSVVTLNDTGDLSGISSLNIASISYPTVDGSPDQFILTNGAGTLSFTSVGDLSGVISGAGTNDRLVRWDISNNIQSSTVALSDAGDLSGVSSLNVASITYPIIDGTPNQAVITNGTGSLLFVSVGDVSGIISGTGTNDRLVRWDVSGKVQSSTVALSDAGDISGVLSINVASITYPTTDGTPNQALSTNGAGTFSFVSVGDGSGVISGTGINDRLVRWDVSNNIQNSTVTLNDAGDLSGISSINVAAITYPTTDGTLNQVIFTNGAGTLSFLSVSDVCGVIAGTGANDRLVRWDVSNNIQNSTLSLNDAGDLSGGTRLNFSGNTQLATTSSYFDFSNIATVFAGVSDCCGSLLHSGLLGTSTQCTMNDASQSTMLCSKLSNMTGSVNSIIVGSDSCSMTNNSSFCGIQNSISSTITNSTNSYIVCSTSSSMSNNNSTLISVANKALIIDSSCSAITNVIADSQIKNSKESTVYCGQQVDIHNSSNVMAMNTFEVDTSGSSCIGMMNCKLLSDLSGSFITMISSQNVALEQSMFTGVISSLSASINKMNTSVLMSTEWNSIDASNSDIIRNTVLSSYRVGLSSAQTTVTNNSVWGGVFSRSWLIDSNTGTYYGLVGAIDTAVPDFAEYFENMYTEIIPSGTLVTLDQGKVRAALANEFILGIVSAQPGLVAGGCDMSWQGTWKKDDWGRYETQTIIEPSWTPGPGQTMADAPTFTALVQNPEYDPNMVYVPRKDRPTEWTVVGLKGQVVTRVDANVVPNDFIKPGDAGVGTTSVTETRVRCMRINLPFDIQKGYAMALCIIE